jgi:hypothetical protein
MLQHDDSHKHYISTAEVREKQADKKYQRGVAKVGGGGAAAPGQRSPREGKTNILNKKVFSWPQEILTS